MELFVPLAFCLCLWFMDNEKEYEENDLSDVYWLTTVEITKTM